MVLACGLAAAGCSGDDGNPDQPIDAGVDVAVAGACGTPAATLSTYPAVHAGATIGAGRHLTADDGDCADQHGYFGAGGEDQVIELTGLTAGAHYMLELATDEDLSMYVATSCTGSHPTDGACLVHADSAFTTETGEFDAPASGTAYVIIDSADRPGPPATGVYSLSVYQSECTDDTQCTAGTEHTCLNHQCVGCADHFDCASATPVCDSLGHTCLAGGAQCTGDDSGEPDDGPAAARDLAFPTAGAPTSAMAAICSLPDGERDWYALAVPAPTTLRLAATWTAADADLDLWIYDATGTEVDRARDTLPLIEAKLVEFETAGMYYVEVERYAPAGAAATPYTLTAALPECATSFDCTDNARPLCDIGACRPGPSACTDDDAAEPDDGPAAARTLNGPIGGTQTRSGAVCSAPIGEYDWYRVDVGAGEGVQVQLDWATDDDLDLRLYDHTGAPVGLSLWVKPEVVTLTYLPAGAYYLRVELAPGDEPAATAYTISATRTGAQTCASRADCATTYSTQLYRGDCTGGVCQFIAGGPRADGAFCDSSDDCTSGECAYTPFEDDADKSVCTHACSAAADCTALGADFRCTTFTSANVCLPSCLRDLDCGAAAGSSMITSGQPWNYFTCTAATGACGP